MPEPNEYKHIAAWGRYLGALSDYVKAAQERASKDEAPINAIYSEPRWVTSDEIADSYVREIVNKYAEE